MARSSLWYDRERMRSYRERAFEVLGRECLRCSYSEDDRALTFDHVADDGREHRGSIGRNAAQWVALHVREAVQRVQVLCANCNRIKESARLASRALLRAA